MEDSCIRNNFIKDLSSVLENYDLKPFNTVIVCNNHIGEGKLLSQNNEESDFHRVMLFVYEKSRKGWIPKNIYRQFPHIIESQIFNRMQAIEMMNNQHNMNEDNLQESHRYSQNDTQELFRRVILKI